MNSTNIPWVTRLKTDTEVSIGYDVEENSEWVIGGLVKEGDLSKRWSCIKRGGLVLICVVLFTRWSCLRGRLVG